MSTFAGHAALGLNVALLSRPGEKTAAYALVVAAAMVADLEGITDLLATGVMSGLTHRQAVHSFAVSCLIGMGIAGLGRALSCWDWRRGLLPCLTAALSHPILDWANGGWGVPLFWPLSRVRWSSPWPVLGHPYADLWGAGPLNFLLWDVLVFGALTMGSLWWRLRRQRWMAVLLWAASLGMLLASHYFGELHQGVAGRIWLGTRE